MMRVSKFFSIETLVYTMYVCREATTAAAAASPTTTSPAPQPPSTSTSSAMASNVDFLSLLAYARLN